MAAEGGDLEGVADAEAAVGGELVLRAADEAGDAPGLPGLAEAVEEPHIESKIRAQTHRRRADMIPTRPAQASFRDRTNEFRAAVESARRHDGSVPRIAAPTVN